MTNTRVSPSPLQGEGAGGWGFGATYDAAGRVQTVTYAAGTLTVNYTYDPATGLLTGVTDDLTGAKVEFAYDADRNLIGIARSNGVDTELAWDSAGRLIGLKDGEILDLRYTLDAAGQVTGAQITSPLDPAMGRSDDRSDDLSRHYDYDAASQLSGEGYEYDARGRFTASPEGTFQWDALSRLTGCETAAGGQRPALSGAEGSAVALEYNALGDLISRRVNSQSPITNLHYNYALGLRPLVAEQDAASGDFQRYYVWAPDGALLYAIEMAGGEPRLSFYHFDRTGSTLALTDAGGEVTDAYTYDNAGNLLDRKISGPEP